MTRGQYLLNYLALSFCFCSQYQEALHPKLLLPPLLVTCSKSEHRVYQQRDNELKISCLWDSVVEVYYSRRPGMTPEKEELDLEPPPHCHWYHDSILVHSTKHWSGQLMLGPGFPGEGPYPPWAYSQIVMQCTTALCPAPLCLHHNMSIEVSGQDVRLFQLWPRVLPLLEWQPIRLAWCARLKSSSWTYLFRSQGSNSSELLIPSNHHRDPLPPRDYPNAELYQICASYYSYYVTIAYPYRGFYTVFITIDHGPSISLSMDFLVEPALLHVFSANSTLLSHQHGSLAFSWSLIQLSHRIVAYQLLTMHDTSGWMHTYSYNSFALQSNFCATPEPHHPKGKLMASIYFRTREKFSGELRGEVEFSNKTLVFRARDMAPMYLMLNPQNIKMGIYIVSRSLGLYYSTIPGHPTDAYSFHYIFYQQKSLCYLIAVDFLQQQLFKFSIHMYLDRKGILFKSLGKKDLEVHVFNSTPLDENVAYVVWFIPIQHPLLQCEWSFHVQIFDSKGQCPIQNYTFAYTNHVRNAVKFIHDSSVLPFNPAQYIGFVAKVKCSGNELIPAILKAMVNVYASKVIKSRVPCCQKPCSITEIRIQRPGTSKQKVYYNTQGTKFTLVAKMQVKCPGPKQTYITWNIYKVPDLTTTPDWSKPYITERDVIILDVSSSNLEVGLYLFNFTMKLASLDTLKSIQGSDSVFVEIGLDNLAARIVGGSFRVVGFSDEWALNGSAYFNGKEVQATQRLSFTWYCTKHKADYASMRLSENGQCHLDQMDLKWTAFPGPVQTVQPETLQENSLYYFRLVVRNGSRTAEAEQTIHVQANYALSLTITCLENCDRSVNPTEIFCLSSKCLNCGRFSRPAYNWSLGSAQSREISFDWSSKSTTERYNSYLCINSFALVPMAEHSYILTLNAITEDGRKATSNHPFHVNGPPRMGKCAIKPKTGVAFLTKFVIQCSGFEDKNGPLTYKVIAASDQMKASLTSPMDNSIWGIIVYVGLKNRTPPSFLPVGRRSQSFAITLYVQVSDALGACSQVTLQATVHNPREGKQDEDHLGLQGLIHGPTAPLTLLILAKDYLNLGYFIYVVASVLNNVEISPNNRSFKTDIQQTLLNVTARIPTTKAPEINQVVLSICQITHKSTGISRKAQLLAAQKLKEASEALKKYKAIGLGFKEAKTLSEAILTGLSNVLRASILNHTHTHIDAVKETISVAEILADLILQGKVPREHETSIRANSWTIHLWKDEKRDIATRTFSDKRHCRNCFHPKLREVHHLKLPAETLISTVLYEFDKNPFPWLLHSDDIHTTVTGFRMTGIKPNGDVIRITPEVVEMTMVRKDEAIFDLTIGPDKKLPKTTGGFNFEVERSTNDVYIQIVTKINTTFHVFVYLDISHHPVAVYTASHHSPPVLMEMASNISDCAFEAPYILCLPQSLLWSPVYSHQADRVNISVVLQSHQIVRDQTTKVVRAAVFAASCLSLDGVQSQWKEGTCRLGPQTNHAKIHCICNAKGSSMRTTSLKPISFTPPDIQFLAGKVLSFSNHTDMKYTLIVPTGQNLLVLLPVLVIVIIYIALAIWVVQKDETDIKEEVIDLPDNDPFDETWYLITIYTGSRFEAGTNADVFIELIGQNGASDVHRMQPHHFPTIFNRASVDTFHLSMGKDLGDISSLHVWHDNYGFSSNWYLSRVQVQNMETKQMWLFMCRKWLAIGKEDSKIERWFNVKDPRKRLGRMEYFSINLSYELINGHLWVSVFAQSIDKSLSRFHRLSCCFAVLLSTLMFNAMFFYEIEHSYFFTVELHYLRAMGIGVGSALISFIVQITLTTLFEKSSKKPEPIKTPNINKECRVKDVLPSTSTFQQVPFSNNNLNSNYEEEKGMFPEKKQKSQKFRWVKYSALLFMFFICGGMMFFIIVLGLKFDTHTASEWLIASVTSFIISVVFLETLKVVLLSAWHSAFAKYCKDIPWSSYTDITFNNRDIPAIKMKQLHNELAKRRASELYQPVKEEKIAIMRKKQEVKYLGYIFFKNMVCHFIFLTLILNVASTTEVTTCFYYSQVMHKAISLDLASIRTIESIYAWMKRIFLPLIHNNDEPTYVSKTWFKILGLIRMRQIRSKSQRDCPKSYQLHNFSNNFLSGIHCHKLYGVDVEDTADYLGSWTTPSNAPKSNSSSNWPGFTYEPGYTHWKYHTYGDINDYSSEGYSVSFFPEEPEMNSTSTLENLEQKKWLDLRTWVVILELTTFNPSVDLFCSISILFEFTNVGPINSSVTVHAYKLPLFNDQSFIQIIMFLCTMYMLIIYIADECYMMYKERLNYMKTVANLVNFGMKVICASYFVLILYKYKLGFDLVQFYLHNPAQFTPFHTASQFDQNMRITMGVLVFLIFLKTYRYFQFMYDVRVAQKALLTALPPMVSISIAGGIVFVAFMSLGHQVFGQHEWNFSKVLHAYTTVLSYCALSFRDTGFTSNKFMGALYLATFLFVMVCIFINLFQVIIMTSYSEIKDQFCVDVSQEADMMHFVFQKIYRIWSLVTTGSEPTTETDICNTLLYGKLMKRRHRQHRKSTMS